MKYTWVGTNLMANGQVQAYTIPIPMGDGRGKPPDYVERFRPTGEQAFFATLEEAKTWCEEQFKQREVEDALDGKELGRTALHYLPAFLRAASIVASGNTKVNGASSSVTAPYPAYHPATLSFFASITSTTPPASAAANR